MVFRAADQQLPDAALDTGVVWSASHLKSWAKKALSMRRWQLLGGLLLAMALPAFLISPEQAFANPSINNTIIGTTAALVGGYILLRKLAAVPGLQIFSYIAPIFSVSYGSVAAVLLLSREDYSRFHLLASFIIAVGFYYLVFLIERRVKRSRLAVIPGGHVGELMECDRADWVVLQSSDEVPRNFDGIVADLRADIGAAWEVFLAHCALSGIPVYHSKQVQESLTGRVAIEHLSENTLGSLNPSSLYVQLKLLFDVLLAAVLLLPVAVICGIAAVFIKLDSKGPVIFTQYRNGYRGAALRVYKLRTMHLDSEGTHYTETADPRITRVGAFLRKYRIDELPQIINILCGDMSWIGPRPEARSLSEWYERELAFYSYRHIVRPGISGWAQVQQGNVARPELVKYKLHFDFYYIKNFSPWLDVVIAAMTVRTILTGFGSR
jgi:lipopolysaccharide/colanic/teichoic acid biosynthesis glycosyltransferase